MAFDTLANLTKPRLRVKVSLKDHSDEPFAQNVLNGLTATPKRLSPKFLYDERGSRLFEQICDLPEYYPTRTERGILERYASEITTMCHEDISLIELGSGSSTKTRLLIEAFLNRGRRLHYVPIDISKSILVNSAKELLTRYRKLRITALVSDYFTALATLKEKQHGQKLILFLGSSIGNFETKQAETFLREIRQDMNEHDMLLIGMDLLKPEEILVPAYDDAQGVTAEFNLNLLRRINRELGGEFDLDSFRHKVIFNRDESRIEMHLQSLRDQTVPVEQLERSFSFTAGETIHTESSYKYSEERIQELAAHSGLRVVTTWKDDREWFSVNLMAPEE